MQEELKADVPGVPKCTYDELFCISVAEAQCAGAYPVTSNVGALELPTMGTLVPGNPTDGNRFSQPFIDAVIHTLQDREQLELDRARVMQLARDRFNTKWILEQWDSLVFGENL